MPASKVMEEFKKGTLHSGSSSGPIVKSKKQAKAIQINMAREEGHNIPKMHSGGVVESSGIYNLQKGETVIPAPPMKTMSKSPEKHTGAAENMGDYGPDESSVARANAPFRDLHKSGHDLNHTYKTPAAAISPDVKAAGTNHSYLHPHSHAGMREVARTSWNTANKIKGMNEMGTGKT